MDQYDDRTSAMRVRRGSRHSRRPRADERRAGSQVIPADHRGGVLEGLAEVERGEFTDAADLAAFFRHYNP